MRWPSLGIDAEEGFGKVSRKSWPLSGFEQKEQPAAAVKPQPAFEVKRPGCRRLPGIETGLHDTRQAGVPF